MTISQLKTASEFVSYEIKSVTSTVKVVMRQNSHLSSETLSGKNKVGHLYEKDFKFGRYEVDLIN